MQIYTVDHRDIILRMTKGKAVIIGDAAHLMMPSEYIAVLLLLHYSKRHQS